MPFTTEKQWMDMFKRTQSAAFQIQRRVEAIANDRTVLVPVGLGEDDPEASTAPLTNQKKQEIKQNIVNQVNAVIADWQASIAP